MNLCLWCDEPTGSDDVLCPECRAVHDHPLFHCDVPGHDIPTLGPRCAQCQLEEERRERRARQNAERLAQLYEIRNQLLRDWWKPWPGAEHGKAIIGNAINNAILEAGGTLKPITPEDLGGEDPYSRFLRAQGELQSRKTNRQPD